MATLNYAYIGVCAGGGHAALDISYNAGPAKRIVYEVDVIRQSLSTLTEDEREMLALLILKVHFAGKTRAQMKTELEAPGGVTVTI